MFGLMHRPFWACVSIMGSCLAWWAGPARADGWTGPDKAWHFAGSAAKVLERRVALSPPARGESRWLPGWHKRVGTYLQD